MLALALTVLLAAPPTTSTGPPAAAAPASPAPTAPAPTSLPRVPGMRLRFGMSESQVIALGSFAEFKAPDAGTMTTRRGPTRFFGVPGDATCYMRDGLLAEVLFDAEGVGTQSQDYVDGQLRMMRFTRSCAPDLTGDRSCDWTAPAVRVHTEMHKGKLTAHAILWPPPEDRAPDSSRAGARASTASPAGAKKTQPATAGAAGAPGAHAPSSPPAGGAKPAASGTGPSATAGAGHTPGAAASGVPPSGAGAAAGTVAAGGATGAATPAHAPAPAPKDSTRHAAAVVATLPETLTITPASRNSPTAWPRIVSSPTLQYPEKAKQESLQGVVWVTAQVDTSGKVMNASIERSIRELDEAALAWVKGSQFAACQRNGAPCRFVVRVAVLFTLY